MDPGKTILIMAGGTGGHVMPALAVAESLRSAGWRIVWMGAPGGMESRIVPRYGYDMTWVDFGGLRGKGLLTQLAMPVRLLRAFLQAVGVLRRIRPSVVLGMGGYISVPGGLVAAAFGRPLVIHEQNCTAGLANRVLARFADRVLTAFPKALPRSRLTGNPVRGDIAAIGNPAHRYSDRSGPLRLLVVGGSLGAQALNETVPRALRLLQRDLRPTVVHQSGEKHLEALRREYEAAGVEGSLIPFIEDMAAAYRDADLVICRAGATTVAELAAAGVASVLVPYPYAVDDHQTANAKFLADAGAAVLLPQRELGPERLAGLLSDLTRTRLLDMAERARTLGRPEAADLVARACVEVAARRAVAGT